MSKKLEDPQLQRAIEWIAYNDDPSELDVKEMSGQISVALAADLYGKKFSEVARRVVQLRIVAKVREEVAAPKVKKVSSKNK